MRWVDVAYVGMYIILRINEYHSVSIDKTSLNPSHGIMTHTDIL